MTLMERVLDHAQGLRFEALPRAVVEAAVTFFTDSVGVGLAGSRHPRVAEVRAAALAWGRGDDARDWRSGDAWPAPTAAMLNAYQIHNQEFDCVHERAVVHPLATILPALMAQAERASRCGQPVSGAEFIVALSLAVDVAATIGCAHVSPMRFFRPAMCGALGSAVGVARLARCDRARMADAIGIAYSQLAGTMQAHTEGSPMLALQVGLASRAAVCAVDLAQAGFSGPHDVLEGPFGYYELFDAPLAPRREAVQSLFARLGQDWRIAELSHKPFPTGRAGHGALDGVLTLQREHGFTAADVAQVALAAPPLVLRLVGRPAVAGMDVNYARLCLGYLVATWLLQGRVGLDDFSRGALDDPQRLALAQRVVVQPYGCDDPNALAPQRVTVRLHDGRELAVDLPAVLGHPLRPLQPDAQRTKFDACCAHAGLCTAATDRLHAACQGLADHADVAALVPLMSPPTSH